MTLTSALPWIAHMRVAILSMYMRDMRMRAADLAGRRQTAAARLNQDDAKALSNEGDTAEAGQVTRNVVWNALKISVP